MQSEYAFSAYSCIADHQDAESARDSWEHWRVEEIYSASWPLLRQTCRTDTSPLTSAVEATRFSHLQWGTFRSWGFNQESFKWKSGRRMLVSLILSELWKQTQRADQVWRGGTYVCKQSWGIDMCCYNMTRNMMQITQTEQFRLMATQGKPRGRTALPTPKAWPSHEPSKSSQHVQRNAGQTASNHLHKVCRHCAIQLLLTSRFATLWLWREMWGILRYTRTCTFDIQKCGVRGGSTITIPIRVVSPFWLFGWIVPYTDATQPHPSKGQSAAKWHQGFGLGTCCNFNAVPMTTSRWR